MLDSVMKRQSRRTYLNSPIDWDDYESLQKIVKRVNREGGLSLRLVQDGGEIFTGCGQNYGGGAFTGVRTLVALVGGRDDPHLMEKCGYYGEQVLLHAVDLGLGTCWVGVDYDYILNPLRLGVEEKFALFIVVGNVPEEMPVMERRFWEMTHRNNKKLLDFFDSDVTPPLWLLSGAAYVSKAPSALNAQKAHFSYRSGKLTAGILTDAAPFVLDLVDLGIAKYHFELGAGGKFALGNPGAYQPEE